MFRVVLMLLLALVVARPAAAEVVDVGPAGFSVHVTADVKALPPAVFRTLTAEIGRWWNADHSFSGDAASLHIDARPGGCFCETMPNGGVQHMVVTHVMAPTTLVLRGGLGPLGSMGIDGAMEWSLREQNGRTRLELTYNVGGYAKGGFAALAPAVDGVLAEQVARLVSLIETGRPR